MRVIVVLDIWLSICIKKTRTTSSYIPPLRACIIISMCSVFNHSCIAILNKPLNDKLVLTGSITVTSHDLHKSSNHGQLDDLFNSYFMLKTKKTPNSSLLFYRNWLETGWWLHKGPLIRKMYLCHDAIMLQFRHSQRLTTLTTDNTDNFTGNHSSYATSLHSWAPSQYKDRLIYVWRFPC